MNFVNTIIQKKDYSDKSEHDGLIVVHLDPIEDGDNIKCVETIVTSYDKDTIDAEYSKWKDRQKEKAIKRAKNEKILEINAYDISDNVNGFILRHESTEIPYWLPAEKRGQLMQGVKAVKDNGGSTYRLDIREQNIYFDIDCDKLIDMLTKLENYAVECYNVTSAHLSTVNAFTKLSDITAFDITADYPKKLKFEI